MKKVWILTIVLSVFAVSTWIQAGTKEEIIRLQSDVLQLQNQILELQKSFDSRSGSTTTLLEQLNDQFSSTNRILEELVAALRQQKGDSNKSFTDIRLELQGLSVKLDDTNNRVAALYQRMEEQQIQAQSRTIPSFADPGGPKPDQVYSLAYNDFLAGNYEIAVSAFRDFLVNFPESEYADNSAYYLGLSLHLLGRTEQAVKAFDEVINLYPKADMTASAYFKKGMVELELQQNEQAIDTFRKLIVLFPDSQEAIQSRQELEMLGVDVSRLDRRR